ncbi:DUF58 domain-containing protein [Agromyces intestinalis]|uniref:DUF58 domain-containing protein n=1 Tax=Agromyces intestinalis TaxID=2592652 RepID=A0A5C1YBS1_9MICO|nr:DUF58 domain-containing protein [Agromyces intestinalis]QEO13416.1 DUF58 domain-containing protein [Agromyces intestinalis]
MSPTPTTTGPRDRTREGVLAAAIAAVVGSARRLAAATVRGGRWMLGVVTPVGWAVAASAAVSLAVGYAFGWLEPVVIGWGLAVTAAVASLWLIGRGAASIRLELSTPRVAVGEAASARLLAENPAGRRLIGLLVEVPVGGRIIERVLPALSRGGRFDESFPIPTERRGVVAVGPVRTVRADPLGIVRREIVWSEPEVLHVHPRIAPVEALGSGLIRDLEGAPTRDLTASDIAFHALREYLPGDDRRHIHWRSSAKTGTFMVRQFEETRRSRLLVVLDLDRSAYRDDAEFELAVSVAGSVGVRAIRDARTVAFVVPGRAGESAFHELPTVSRDRLLDALCLVEADDRAVRLPDVARAAGEGLDGLSLAILATGSAHGVGRVRQAAARLPSGIESIAVLCAPSGSPSARQVGALTVFRAASLDDLRVMLARSAAA